MVRALVAALMVFIIVGASVRAQTDQPASTPLRFDAASIKLHQSDDANGAVRLLPDRSEVVNLLAKSVIAFAYDLRSDQVVGGPGWRGMCSVNATGFLRLSGQSRDS
jgi:hypothetical protein